MEQISLKHLKNKTKHKKKKSEGSAPSLGLLSSKPTFAKLNIYFIQLNAFNDRIFLVLYFGFLVCYFF